MNDYWKQWNYLRGHPDLEKRRQWRLQLAHTYAWAVPTDEALDEIADHAPILEIGAGGGYWAHLLRDERGVDILAFDTVVSSKENPAYGGPNGDGEPWTDVLIGGPEKIAEHPDRTLFLCWPPYNDPMARQCLEAYRGDVLLYIGSHFPNMFGPLGPYHRDPSAVVDGDLPFHRELERCWACNGDVTFLPNWTFGHLGGTYDTLTRWTRRQTPLPY